MSGPRSTDSLAGDLPARGSGLVDDLLEELLPSSFDWRDFVQRYPKTTLTVAALGGLAIGKGQGREIVGALAGFATGTLSRHLNEWIGEDVL